MSENYSYYNGNGNGNGNAGYHSQFQQQNSDYYDYPNDANARGGSRGGYRRRNSDATASNGQRGSSYGRSGDYRNNNGEYRSNSGGGYRSNRRFERDDGPKFTIVESFGSFHTDPRSGYTKEVNLVSWNDAKPKFDIRPWSPHHDKMGKGLTFTPEEFVRLHIVMSAMFLAREDLKSMYYEIVKEEMNNIDDPKSPESQMNAASMASHNAPAASQASHNAPAASMATAAYDAPSPSTVTAATAAMSACSAFEQTSSNISETINNDPSQMNGNTQLDQATHACADAYSQACESQSPKYSEEQSSTASSSCDSTDSQEASAHVDPYTSGTTNDHLFDSAESEMNYDNYDDIDEDDEDEEQGDMPF